MTSPWLDTIRLPGLTSNGRQILKHMVEHPYAPKFHNRSGHHLTGDDLLELEAFKKEQDYNARHNDFAWLEPFTAHCRRQVPFYQQYAWQGMSFDDIPCIDRSMLSQDITAFVPTHLPLDRLIIYETSGTSGHTLTIPSHPLVAASYHYFHDRALNWNEIDTLANSESDIAVILAGYQRKCFTYVSCLPYWRNKGLAKLNFHPLDWHHPDHREKYLDAMAPDFISGDPLSLSELSKLSFRHKPQAVISTSMTLLKGQKQAFSKRFACPVIDIYSLNEAGPIAATDTTGIGWRLLQTNMLVEILDEAGKPVPNDCRGEITLTGGFNPYLPLLRYRTGDYASLHITKAGISYLKNLEGRPPVYYITQNGEWLNNVDITHLLQEFALPQYQFHQMKNKDISLQIRGYAEVDSIKKKLWRKFGSSTDIEITIQKLFKDKVIQYSSDLIRTE